jgi:hypothetical protein
VWNNHPGNHTLFPKALKISIPIQSPLRPFSSLSAPHPRSPSLVGRRWALLYTASGGSALTLGPRPQSSRSTGGWSQGSEEGGLASALPFIQAVSDQAYQFFYRWLSQDLPLRMGMQEIRMKAITTSYQL